MRRALLFAAVFVGGVGAGWLVRGGAAAGHPEEVRITMPSREPGKFQERHDLTVTSTNEGGHAVNLGGDGPRDEPGAKVWKVKLVYAGGREVPLFCEELR
jgi:hypothetical protein